MFTDADLAGFHDAMHGLVDSGTLPGVVTLLAHGNEVHIDAVGVSDIATGAPLRDDAIVPHPVDDQADPRRRDHAARRTWCPAS